MTDDLLKTLRPALRLLFIALILVICWLAFSPAPPDMGLSWDKAKHALAFATLAFVGRQAWPELSPLRLALVLVAYGGFIEIVQSFLPPREADLHDVLADAVGIALGLVAASLLQRWIR